MTEQKRVEGLGVSGQSAERKIGDSDFITIARVVKTQGRIGEVAAAVLTDFPERFATRKRLFAKGPDENAPRRELQLVDHWFHKDWVVLKFAGVDSISDAEALAGCEIQLPLGERAELDADSFYVSDLAGCIVYDGEREVGKIQDVRFGAGEAPLLVVQGVKEYLIPFAAGYIRGISPENKRVEMDLPQGMLELDAPLNQEEKQRQKGPDRDRP
jgi:16S rRNA processing protein RimM